MARLRTGTEHPYKYHPKVTLGQDVKVDFGLYNARGVAIEFRGFLGVGGTPVWRVRIKTDGEPIDSDVPESRIHPVKQRRRRN